MTGSQSITLERQRQIEVSGFDAAHDDQHSAQELIRAARCYMAVAAMPAEARKVFAPGKPPLMWPWAAPWWKPTDPRRDLVKAGALIAASIDQLDRATRAESIAVNGCDIDRSFLIDICRSCGRDGPAIGACPHRANRTKEKSSD